MNRIVYDRDERMMDELAFGTRDRRGDWRPNARIEIAPLFRRPFRPLATIRWLPQFLIPWHLLFALSALLYWYTLVPDTETLRHFSWSWVLRLYAVNSALILLFYGALEFRLYFRRAQANRFKYNHRFPADAPNAAFLFGNQSIEGMLRTFLSAIPIWTAYEVLILWCYANGVVTWTAFADHPFALGLFALLVPIWHEAHFYTIHRFIHRRPLYRWIHSVHHRAVNPSPWSSLSMHSVEHLLYFSTCLLHLILPSNPILALYQLHTAGFGAVVGHIGFDRIEYGNARAFDCHAYTHYLHHRYFEVNYGDGVVPLDKLFGSWHDGSAEAHARMEKRFERNRARPKAS